MIQVKINSESEQKTIQQYSIDTRDDFLNRIAIELETLKEFLTIEKTRFSEDGSGSISEVWVKNIASGIFKKRNWEEIERTLDSEAAVSKKEKILLLKFYMFKKADDPYVQNVVKHYYYSIFIKIIGENLNIEFDEWYENSINEIGYIISKRNNYNDKISKIGFVIDSITTEKIDTELVNKNSMTTYRTLSPSLNINLEDICNECIPSVDIPFVSFKNIYKINKNFKEKIDESWQSSGENEVLFKVLKKYSKKQKKSIFTDTFVRDDPPRIDVDSIFDSRYINKLKNMKIGPRIGRVVDVDSLPKEERIEDRTTCRTDYTELKDIFNFENPITSRYTSSFYILDQAYLSYFILDMIMNDNFFSFFLISNESYIVNRKKNKIFATFRETGPINSRITLDLKTIIIDEASFRDVDNEAVDKHKADILGEFINKEAVYVKIKSPTIELAEYCKYLITKLFSLYNRKIEEYIGIYTTFNSSFTLERPTIDNNIKKAKTLKLKNIEPNIFIKGYGCNNKPMILESYKGATDTDDLTMARISKGELFVFPKESINIVDFSEAGRRAGDEEKKEITIVPKIYGCDHLPNTKYPGVKKNVLSNSIYFPFLPCCFTDNQVTKKTSNTYKYIKNIKKKKQKGYQQNVIITKKAMEFKYYGSLDIKLFNLCKESENEIYYREGVCENIENSDPDSFIKCMLKATGKSETPTEVRNNIISDERYMAICKQELYDYTDEEIKSILSTESTCAGSKVKYIRPQEFCSVMEQYFDCNIFIFSNVINVNNKIKTKVSFAANTKKSPELDLPRNTHSYLRFIRQKCVFVYENVGSYSNYFDFPICEIIVRHEYLSKKNFYIFDSESTLGKISTELINSMRSFFFNKIPITSNIKPFSLENIEGQLIDSYGKTRGLLFKKKSIIIPVYTQPLPISFVKSISFDRFASYNSIGISDLKLNDFISSIENILSIKAYTTKGGASKRSLPLAEASKRSPTALHCGSTGCSAVPMETSELIKYIQNKKYSNFMKQNIYFNLSHFLKFENPSEEGDLGEASARGGDRSAAALQVDKFFNDVILVDPNVQYTITTNFEKKKRIWVKSDETKKRLLYLTTHEFIHNKEFILNFYKNTKLSIELTIPNMFKTSEFIIFDSFSDILNWTPDSGSLVIPKTVSYLSPSLNYPLFYFNKDLSEVPFFVHKPTHNINTLVPDPKTPFLMYCYSNNNNIKLYQINKGKITDNSPNIIAFRFESNIFYMSLTHV